MLREPLEERVTQIIRLQALSLRRELDNIESKLENTPVNEEARIEYIVLTHVKEHLINELRGLEEYAKV